MVSGQLIYGDTPIRTRGEMVCLTEMWRAAGSDPSKRPVNWLASVEAKNFIRFLEESLNVRNSDLLQIEQGRSGSTWAHWQIGLAYAKYLSPKFHAWCNTVVRSHMQLTRIAVPSEMTALAQLFDQKLEPIRSDIKEIKTDLKLVVDNSNKGRKRPTVETERFHHKGICRHYYFNCPCGECDIQIANENGFIQDTWEYHHQYGAWDNRPEATIPLAIECHQRITNDVASRRRFDQTAFPEFQNSCARMQPKQLGFWLRLPNKD
jgi:hypothetical protein